MDCSHNAAVTKDYFSTTTTPTILSNHLMTEKPKQTTARKHYAKASNLTPGEEKEMLQMTESGAAFLLLPKIKNKEKKKGKRKSISEIPKSIISWQKYIKDSH